MKILTKLFIIVAKARLQSLRAFGLEAEAGIDQNKLKVQAKAAALLGIGLSV